MDAPAKKSVTIWIDVALIAAVGVAMLIWTWDKGPDPIVDFGRECYVPWRISEGDVLYRGIHYFNGPLSPYLNAYVFKLAGVSLRSLKIANALLIAICAALIYHLIRQISDRIAATSAAIVFLILFAFARILGVGNYNFLTPYSHELTHGMTLSLAAIASLMAWQRRNRIRWLALCGFLLGLIFLTKAEVFLAALLSVGSSSALILWTQHERRPWRATAALLGCFVIPICVAFILQSKKLGALPAFHALAGSWAFLTNKELTGQRYFKNLSGMSDIGGGLVSMAKMSLVWIALLVPAAGLGWALRDPRKNAWRIFIALAWATLTAAALWLMRFSFSWDPIARPLPALDAIVSFWLLVRIIRMRNAQAIGAVMLSIFALAASFKIVLNVKLSHYGFALAMPGAMLLIAAGVSWLPKLIDRRGGCGLVPRLTAIAVLLVVVSVHLWITSFWFGLQSTTLAEGTADEFRADFRGGPMARFVDDLRRFTTPEQTLVMMPEGLMANYLARRVNPTTHLNFTPPALIMYDEQRMLTDFKTHPPDYIGIVNNDSQDYGPRFFGRDYGRELMRWIDAHYSRVATYGASIDDPEKLGGITLFHRKTP